MQTAQPSAGPIRYGCQRHELVMERAGYANEMEIAKKKQHENDIDIGFL